MTRRSLWCLAVVASLIFGLVLSQAPRPATVSAQGVDELEAIQHSNYVTDDNLLAADKDPNNWLLWADLATVGTHGTWKAPARRALELNPLAPELAEFRQALRRGS